nr:3-hydroxyacyl-CoA dehydrogenase family protein [Bifidobacterium callitrichos]
MAMDSQTNTKATESTEPTAADTAPANGGTAVNLEDITTIASIGTGTMGHAIALQFALAGYPTRLIGRSESSLNRAMTNIRADATTLANADLLWDDESVDDVLARIMPVIGYERGVAGADFVIEAIAENLDVKHEAWQEIERFAPADAIFATNTSGLSPTAIASVLAKPERFVVAHFWNPAHLMPLVEVVPGERTDPQVLGTTVELMKRIGKKPAQLNREALGFIGNRLQMAVLREEFHIIQEGIADAATVDDVMKYSLGRRWNLVGPVASIDLGGLDVFYNISTYLFDDMDNGTGPSPLLTEKVKAGDLGAKTGRGFFSWQGETGKRIIERRDAALLQALKEDMTGDEDR